MDDESSILPLPKDGLGLHQRDSRHLQTHVSDLFGNGVADTEFIDVTITSPPYADMINYDTDIDTQVGFGDNYGEYLNDLRSIFKQIYALTEQEGSLWVVVNSFRREGRFVNLPNNIVRLCENLNKRDRCPNCGTSLTTIHNSISPECGECGFSTRAESWKHHDTIIWDKVRARPYAQNTFRNVFEYILCFKKTDTAKFDFDNVRIADETELEQWWVDWPERYNPRGKIPDNIWEMVTPTQGGWNQNWPGHPAPFPPELVERILHLTTESEDVVFDPFAGSGTTIAQADLMDRRSFGFELSETYYDRFEEVSTYLAERWAERQANNETLGLKQQRFERTIWGLRQLIYAKKASAQLRNQAQKPGNSISTIGDIGLHSIIVESSLPDPADISRSIERMETDYTYIFDTDVDGSQYLGQLEAMTSEDPWNGFEITPNITINSVAEVSYSNLPTETGGPYLYTNGKHEAVARSLSLGAWQQAKDDPARWRSQTASTHCPAIISNLFVTVERGGEGAEVSTSLLEDPPEDAETASAAKIKDTEEYVDTALSDYF